MINIYFGGAHRPSCHKPLYESEAWRKTFHYPHVNKYHFHTNAAAEVCRRFRYQKEANDNLEMVCVET